MKVSLFNETRSQVAISMIKLKAVLNVFIFHLHFLSAGDGRAFQAFLRSVSYAGSNQVRFYGLIFAISQQQWSCTPTD